MSGHKDQKPTDALKNWLDSLGETAPGMIDSVLPQGSGADWREVVLASMFDPAASAKSRAAAPAANDESKPAPAPRKPKS
jgi:hypothetical protein